MKRNRLLKGSLVVFGAIILSTLAINATDEARNIRSSLVGLAVQTGSGGCPVGMTVHTIEGRSLCVDVYEVSTNDACTHTDPKSVLETEENVSGGCVGESSEEKMPWRFVSLSQAQRICALRGARLPTNEEWYKAALGSETQSGCRIDAGPEGLGETGTAGCVSAIGAHDMIGNVWEWVDEEVRSGQYREQALPPSGYVASVDKDGVALTTGSSGDVLYGEDYFWSAAEGVFGIIRGGFFNSESDGGLYALNASVEPSFASPGVGFRCVQDI